MAIIRSLSFHYPDFGLYVNCSGDLLPSRQKIEWFNTAERVAYHAPYILLFSPHFIEVRHVETGQLTQIVTGNNIRCIWDGRGVSNVSPPTPGMDGWDGQVLPDPMILVVLNGSEVPPASRKTRVEHPIAQHICEFVPMAPPI